MKGLTVKALNVYRERLKALATTQRKNNRVWYSYNNKKAINNSLKSFDELFRKNKKLRILFKTKKNLVTKFKEWQLSTYNQPLKQDKVEWHHYALGSKIDGGQYRIDNNTFKLFLKQYKKYIDNSKKV